MAGFLGRMFGGRAPDSTPPSSTFDDSTAREVSREATRRELLHSVARDTMRRYAIPTAWIEVRMLAAAPGLHLVLVVREEAQQMYDFIRSFEEGVTAELRRLDSRADSWLGGISWQFTAKDMPTGRRTGPAPAGVAAAAVVAEAVPARAAAGSDVSDEKAAALADLEKLFAVRDAELRHSSRGRNDFQPTQPAGFDSDRDFEPSGDGFAPTEPGKL